MIGQQLLRIIAGLFVGIWVARYLGPEQFGLFSYVLAFTAIFGGIAKLGLDGIMVRELVNHLEKRDTYLGTAFWLKVLGAFLVMGLMAAIVPFTSNDATTNLFIFIISAGLVFQSFEVIDFYFQSQVLAKIVSICKVIQIALSSIIKITLALIEAELIWFVLVTAFDALSLAVSYFIAYQLRKTSAFYKHFDLSIAKQLLKDSWPFIFTALIVSIYMKIDQLMIMEMFGAKSVGHYSVGVTLSTAWYFVPTIIANSLLPAMVSSRKNDINLFYVRLQNLFTLMIWVALTAALFVTFTSHYIIGLFYGEAYAPASDVLMIHIWGGLAVAFGIVWSKWILVENLQKYIVVFHLISMVVNILMNYFLIPVYGIVGAALATAVANIFAQIMGLLFYKRKMALKFLLNGFFPFYLLNNR